MSKLNLHKFGVKELMSLSPTRKVIFIGFKIKKYITFLFKIKKEIYYAKLKRTFYSIKKVV